MKSREEFYEQDYRPAVATQHKRDCQTFAAIMVCLFGMVGLWVVLIQCLAWLIFGEPVK